MFFGFVSVPPEKPVVFDRWGRQVNLTVGPLAEGDDLALICRVIGGKSYKLLLFFCGGGEGREMPFRSGTTRSEKPLRERFVYRCVVYEQRPPLTQMMSSVQFSTLDGFHLLCPKCVLIFFCSYLD